MYWSINTINLDIDELIPHRRPLELIDEILEVDEDSAVTGWMVTERWPLFENAPLSSSLGYRGLSRWPHNSILK